MSTNEVSKEVSEKTQAAVESVKAEVSEVKETIAATTLRLKKQ